MRLEPDITVIVPFYRNTVELARCLAALLQSDLQEHFEVIVVDDHGPEGERANKLTTRFGVEYLRLPQNSGPGIARNCGAALARGHTLVFLDSDCVPASDWMRILLGPIRNGQVKAATSCYSSPIHSSWITEFQNEDYLYRMPGEECDVFFVNSCNLAIDRETFLRCSGFPQQRISEDMVLGMWLAQQGTPSRYLPCAGVQHNYHRTLRNYLKQRFAFASNTVRSLTRISKWSQSSNHKPVRSFNPVRTVLGVILSALIFASFFVAVVSMAASSGYALLFVIAGLTMLLLEVLVHANFLLFLARRQGSKKALSYVPLLLVIDLTYGAGVAIGVAAGLVDRIQANSSQTAQLATTIKDPIATKDKP